MTRDLRRGFVFSWLLKGYSATPITQAWNKDHPDHAVSVKTIEADITTVMNEMRQKTIYDAVQFRNISLARLEVALNAIQSKVEAGELGAIDRWVNIIFKQATIAGSVAPAKIALTDATGTKSAGVMSDDERKRRLLSIFDGVRAREGMLDEDYVVEGELLSLPEPVEVAE